MLLLAACDNYLDIQPTGSVIPNSLAEYRALLARSYKDVSKFSDRGMACFRSDEMQVRDNEYDQNYYMDIERWNDLAPMPIPHRLNGPSITMCFLLPITLLRAEVILRKALRKR